MIRGDLEQLINSLSIRKAQQPASTTTTLLQGLLAICNYVHDQQSPDAAEVSELEKVLEGIVRALNQVQSDLSWLEKIVAIRVLVLAHRNPSVEEANLCRIAPDVVLALVRSACECVSEVYKCAVKRPSCITEEEKHAISTYDFFPEEDNQSRLGVCQNSSSNNNINNNNNATGGGTAKISIVFRVRQWAVRTQRACLRVAASLLDDTRVRQHQDDLAARKLLLLLVATEQNRTKIGAMLADPFCNSYAIRILKHCVNSWTSLLGGDGSNGEQKQLVEPAIQAFLPSFWSSLVALLQCSHSTTLVNAIETICNIIIIIISCGAAWSITKSVSSCPIPTIGLDSLVEVLQDLLDSKVVVEVEDQKREFLLRAMLSSAIQKLQTRLKTTTTTTTTQEPESTEEVSIIRNCTRALARDGQDIEAAYQRYCAHRKLNNETMAVNDAFVCLQILYERQQRQQQVPYCGDVSPIRTTELLDYVCTSNVCDPFALEFRNDAEQKQKRDKRQTLKQRKSLQNPTEEVVPAEEQDQAPRMLMFHKPRGVVTTRKDNLGGRKTVFDVLPAWVLKDGWLPVGRLDKESTGLLLFTRDGYHHLAQRLLSPTKHLLKTYEVVVRGRVTQEHIDAIYRGIETPNLKVNGLLTAVQVTILEELHQCIATPPAAVVTPTTMASGSGGGGGDSSSSTSSSGANNNNSSSNNNPADAHVGLCIKKTKVKVVLDEGKNRHIRRMFQALLDPDTNQCLSVLELKRVAFGQLQLREDELPPGQWRYLSNQQFNMLFTNNEVCEKPTNK